MCLFQLLSCFLVDAKLFLLLVFIPFFIVGRMHNHSGILLMTVHMLDFFNDRSEIKFYYLTTWWSVLQ